MWRYRVAGTLLSCVMSADDPTLPRYGTDCLPH